MNIGLSCERIVFDLVVITNDVKFGRAVYDFFADFHNKIRTAEDV